VGLRPEEQATLLTATEPQSGIDGMPNGRVDAEIRSLIEPYASELAELLRRAVLRSVEQALDPGTARRRSKVDAPPRGKLTPVPRRGLPGPVRSTAPLSLESYERMAVQRALAECEGNMLAAAKLLRIGKSTMYRRVHDLVLAASRQGRATAVSTADPLAASGAPVSLKAYERLPVERALAEAGGRTLAAAKLLRVSKSRMYRMVDEHGLK
jgi:DNA-binding NtrC family response regulator